MTRRDYIRIAAVLIDLHQQEKNGDGGPFSIPYVAQCLSDAFHADNPRHDRAHFLAVVEGKKPLNSRPASGSRTGRKATP